MSRLSAQDRVIADLAAQQHGVVSCSQLLQRGVPRHLVDVRLDTGRLLPLHHGVYAVGHTQLRREGRWLAAVLAVGADAVLDHGHAAALWGLAPEPDGPVRVTLPGRNGRIRRRGVRVHRPVLFAPEEEVTVHDGIPTTTVARTLLDVATTVRGRRLEHHVRRAAQLRIFDLVELHAVLERHPRHRAAPELRRLIARMDGRGTEDLRSVLEALFLQVCDDHGFPPPIVNGHVEGERVDFHWPGARLVIETDGFEWHSTPTAFAEDRARDQRLTLAGWRVVRFTWDQVRDERRRVAQTVVALLSRGADRPTYER